MTISKEIFMRLVERYASGYSRDKDEIFFKVYPDRLPAVMTNLDPAERAIEIVNKEIQRLAARG
jgi:hypothetical protein